MSTPLRFGLVGAGGIAQAHSQAFASLSDADLVGVADLDTDAATAMAAVHGARAFTTHTELLAEGGLDALVVCTPPITHGAIIHEALDQGVAVLSEKPFTIDTQSARRLFERSLDAGTTLTMASKFRFVADVIEARRLIRSGAIGEPVIFENAFTSHVDMSRRWNSDPDISGGGVLIDNGTHSADIVRYLLGPITEVMAVEGKRVQNLAVEDTAKMFLRTTTGVMASVDLSWSLDKSLEHFIWVYGTEGELRVGWRESSTRQHSGDTEWSQFGTGYEKLACMQAQLQNLCNALRGTEELVITAEDALSSVGVIEAAYQSLATSEWRHVTTRVAARNPVGR